MKASGRAIAIVIISVFIFTTLLSNAFPFPAIAQTRSERHSLRAEADTADHIGRTGSPDPSAQPSPADQPVDPAQPDHSDEPAHPDHATRIDPPSGSSPSDQPDQPIQSDPSDQPDPLIQPDPDPCSDSDPQPAQLETLPQEETPPEESSHLAPNAATEKYIHLEQYRGEYTLTPEEAAAPYTGAEPAVATIENGKILAHGTGIATITFTLPNGDTTICKISIYFKYPQPKTATIYTGLTDVSAYRWGKYGNTDPTGDHLQGGDSITLLRRVTDQNQPLPETVECHGLKPCTPR